ncbi:restriction endonuclease subunit S [Tenacibaculum maritimum]|nr:restriction endonuclease subunit S [Tenacibaculum maritimum]
MNYLKTIPFSEFNLWDVKRFVKEGISSSFPIVNLGKYINQRSEKVKLFDFPEDDFGILGVNNKEGIFDAYTEKGKNINQAYKKVELNDLAYNPYRVNVGSIGWKTLNQVNNFISPAYVVFECLNGLNSEYLYRMFKTDTFNKIINDNTTGSVRQNLKYDTLKSIRIPLPPKEEQDRIVATYNQKITLAERQEEKAKQLEQDIEEYLYDILEIEKLEEVKEAKFRTIGFKEVDRWSVETLGKFSKIESKFKGKYELVKLRKLIKNYQYGLSEKSSKEKIGPPMLRMNNIDNSELRLGQLKYISIDDKTKNKYQLDKNDLLFNRTNSKELVGKTAIFNIDDSDFTFASYLIRVKINQKKADINYINYLFNSSILQYQKDLVSRQITGQANINAQEMQDFLFPYPDLGTQVKIANHISGLKSEIKKLKEQAIENRKQAITDFEKEIFS